MHSRDHLLAATPGIPRALRPAASAMASVGGGQPDVLMIDNYDSFTYNLVQYLEELGAGVVTRRHDQLTRERAARGGDPLAAAGQRCLPRAPPMIGPG